MPKVPNTPGVYKIVNKVTGLVYVGSSSEINGRWVIHKRELRCNRHCNKHMQSAWNKYGESAFALEVIEAVAVEQLLQREEHHIKTLDAGNPLKGYNKCLLPTRGTAGLRWKRDPASTERIAAKTRGRKRPPRSAETRLKISLKARGRKPSSEAIAKNRASHLGKKRPPRSPEWCARLSAALKGRPWSAARSHV